MPSFRIAIRGLSSWASNQAKCPHAELFLAAKDTKDLARQALDHFQRSREMLRQGNWSGYGEELKRLETPLRQMQTGR